jgi:hypothetical protein
MSLPATTGLTLDAGALLALDEPAKAPAMQARLEAVRRRGGTIYVPPRPWRRHIAAVARSASPGC